MNARTFFRAACTVALAGMLWGCGEAQKTGTGSTSKHPAKTAAPEAAPELPPALFVKEAPANSKDVKAAREGAKPGDSIVLRGRIGTENPFNPELAVLMVSDMSLTPCNEKEGDGCKTPWDFCCDDKKDIAAGTACVQVIEPSGKVIRKGLQGVNGMGPLDIVVVSGIVDASSTAHSLVVNAQGIFIEKKAGLSEKK